MAATPRLFKLVDPGSASGAFTQYVVSGQLSTSSDPCLPLSNAAQVAYLLYAPSGPSGPSQPYLASASCTASWGEWTDSPSLASLVAGCFPTMQGHSSAGDMGTTKGCQAAMPGATAWGSCFAAEVQGGSTGTVQDVATGKYWASGGDPVAGVPQPVTLQAQPQTWSFEDATPLFQLSTEDGQYLSVNAVTGGFALVPTAAQATVLEPFNGQLFLHGSASAAFTVAPGEGVAGPLAPVPSASRLTVSPSGQMTVATRQPTAFRPTYETYIQFGSPQGTAGWYPLLCSASLSSGNPATPVLAPGTNKALGLRYATDMLATAPHPELMIAWLLPAFLKGGLAAPPSPPSTPSKHLAVLLGVGIPIAVVLIVIAVVLLVARGR